LEFVKLKKTFRIGNFIKHKMDLEVASELLTKELDVLNKSMQVYGIYKSKSGLA